jgi:acyl-CoA thioesterase 8
VREGGGGSSSSSSSSEDKTVRHALPLPVDPATGQAVRPPPDGKDGEREGGGEEERTNNDDEGLLLVNGGPVQTCYISVENKDSPAPHAKKTRQWVRAKGAISAGGGHQAHLNALAYMSDSHFVGTLARIHRLWLFPFAPRDLAGLDEPLRTQMRRLAEFEGQGDLADMEGRPAVGMLVSLDHSIFFHEPRRVRADEWMFTEMESPWAGDGRGVVTQRIFARDGTLLATCFQEGVIRLKEEVKAGDDGNEHAREWKL